MNYGSTIIDKVNEYDQANMHEICIKWAFLLRKLKK